MKQETKFKQTEIGMIPEDWGIRNLGDIVMITTGKLDSNCARDNGIYPFFTCAPKPLKIDDYVFDCKAILLAGNNANGVFHLNFYKGKFNAYQRTYVLTSKEGVDLNLRFLYYQLNLRLNYFKEISQGTATRFLTMRILDDLEIDFPSLLEQTSIAKILSDLDSKIELFQKQNKTLEAIGQAIFKHWFVNFEFPNEEGKPYKSSGGEMVFNEETGKEIPRRWEVKPVGQYLNIVKGCSYKSEDLKESESALVTLKSINRGGGFNQNGYKEYTGDYKEEQIVRDGEIIVAQTDLTQNAEVVGTPAIINSLSRYDKLIASLDLQILRIKDKLNKGFLYFLLKTRIFHNHALSYTNGTTVLHLNKNAVPNFEFVIPSETTLNQFGQISNKVIEKMNKNEKEAFILSQIRDSLLPRLMSGRIRVVMGGGEGNGE